MQLLDQVALITGGGRGIGRATALAFAEAGARVVVASRTQAEVDAVTREVQAKGRRALPIASDVSDAASVQELVDRALAEFGTIDILVNCAGVIHPIGPAWQVGMDEWTRNLAVNLTGVFLCSRTVLPTMIAARRGHIVNVSSGAAVNARYGWSAYCAAKAAVDQFTRVLALEVQPYGIAVNAVYPGLTDTRMQEEIRAVPDEAMGPGGVERFRQFKSQGVLRPPEVPARLIVWLAQQEGITGQVFDVNDAGVRRRAGLESVISEQ